MHKLFRKNKKIDLTRIIDKKDNYIYRNAQLIDNLYARELYTSYVLSHQQKKVKPNYEKIIQDFKKNKTIEKFIIKDITKNIPPNMLQYFGQYEFQKFADKIVGSIHKNKDSIKVIYFFSTIKKKLNSRKESGYQKYKKNIENKTFNKESNKTSLNNYSEDERKIIEKKLNRNQIENKKKKFLSAPRKKLANLFKYIAINENNNDDFNNNVYNTVSTKTSKCRHFILNSSNKKLKILTDEDTKKNSNNTNLNSLFSNIDKNNLNIIHDYNYIDILNRKGKLSLDLSNSKERIKKIKFSSKKLLNNSYNYKRNQKLDLYGKKINLKNRIKSSTPRENHFTGETENIINNLQEIKKEINKRPDENLTDKDINNIQYFLDLRKFEKNKDKEFLIGELKENHCFDFIKENKKKIENKSFALKTLRNSYNISDKNKNNVNGQSIKKTLNNICLREKNFEELIDNIYQNNFWLRLNRSKKIEKNINETLDKIKKNRIVFNTLISKINKIINK
jgi:hypothetical protein